MGACEISGDESQQNPNLRVLEVTMGASTMFICCIDLHLAQFNTRAKLSFRTADQLFGWLASLPTGPQWQSTPINLNGYEPVRDVRLIWRDGLEVVKDLFSNPIFAKYMTYNPHKVTCGTDREYSEFFTGTHAFEIQVSLACTHQCPADILSIHRPNFLQGPQSYRSFSPQIRRQSCAIRGVWRCTPSS